MKKLINELSVYQFTANTRDDINDHAADAFRYAMINGVFSSKKKKRNWKALIAWLVIGLAVGTLILKYLLDTVGNIQ
jgi:hypothetical protein